MTTSKQITIDGVPVQDCVFFYTDIQEEIICDLYPTCGGCEGIDCYYKQLKRKEQECERLTSTVTEIKEIAETAIKEMYTTKSDDYTDGYRWLGSIILQKISEVIND